MSSNTIHYYIVRWKHPEKGWITSTFNKASKEQAEAQMERDVNYFYSDIPVQLVKVTERVITEMRGLQDRKGW